MKWIPVKGYEGLYEVSDNGQVRSLYCNRSNQGGLLKPKPHPCGYLAINLYKDKKCHTHLIHRIMMDSFSEYRPDLIVNHINGIKTDNRLENLEMVTYSDNVRHAHKLKLIPFSGAKGERNGRAKLTDLQALQIKLMKGAKSQRIIAEMFDVSVSTIESIMSGRRKVA